MKTTILLGPPGDQVSVPDGASVPLISGKRGKLHRYDGLITLRFELDGFVAQASVVTRDGSLVGRWVRDDYIDLPALRRELAPKPKVVGGWTHGVFNDGNRLKEHSSITLHSREYNGFDRYWTHRPGNTPEKQAAFDEALRAWMKEEAEYGRPGTRATNDLEAAARALGYGEGGS